MANTKFNDMLKVTDAFMVKPIRGIENVFIDLDSAEKFSNEPSERFNKKTWMNYEERKQRKNEIAIKKVVWNKLSKSLKKVYPKAYLALGGSTINECGTRDSDLDLCVAIRSPQNGTYDISMALDVLIKCKKYLEEEPYIDEIGIKDRARVPILNVTLKFPYNSIGVDINCNCVAGIYNSHLLRHYALIDKRVPVMITFLKDWGRETEVINPYHGGINSYCMSLMVIHFLQSAVYPPILPNLIALYPDEFNGSIDIQNLDYERKFEIPKNKRTIAELLYGFANYYSQFEYATRGISIRQARVFNRNIRPDSDRCFLFFLEEAYDGLTIAKNLIYEDKLNNMISKFESLKGQLLCTMDVLFRNTGLDPEDNELDLRIEEQLRKAYGQ